jgi:hypothetical protein
MPRTSTKTHQGSGIPDLLLEHCAALDRLDEARTPAVERLELALGDDLTRLLVSALTASGTTGRPPQI